MVTLQQALDTVIKSAKYKGDERVPFTEALHRVLAEDVFSDIDMPPFDKAAMDGFACKKDDLGLEMDVIETIAAGDVPSKPLARGQCARIMTGAMLPEGADTVIMVEQTEYTGEEKIRFTAEKTFHNIAYQAEDVKSGDLIWQKGMPILPSHIAVFAAVGCTEPLVAKKVKVGILSTGDELVEPHIKPGPGKIRNSNAWQLTAQVKAMNCTPNYMGIVPDTLEDSKRFIAEALAANDVVLLTGGVSMGDFDFIPQAFKENDVEILFQKVEVKPGRPTVFGINEKAWVFGLPGNPVSSFINFELLVKPLLYKIMGHDFRPLMLELPLGVDFQRKKADRQELLPVKRLESGEVVPVNYHGSAHIHAISFAFGIMNIPKGVTHIKKGEIVHVRPI